MEKFLLSIFIIAMGFTAIQISRFLSPCKCPKCGKPGKWKYSRKDGGPDLRFKYNQIICSVCIKQSFNLEIPEPKFKERTVPKETPNSLIKNQSSPASHALLEISSKFREDDWVVYESKKYPHARAIFRVYKDKNQRLQPFKLDAFDIGEYRHAQPEEVPQRNDVD